MDRNAESFIYEHCDVPAGIPLAEWRQREAPQPHRRARLAGGLVAALATFAPTLISLRAARHR